MARYKPSNQVECLNEECGRRFNTALSRLPRACYYCQSTSLRQLPPGRVNGQNTPSPPIYRNGKTTFVREAIANAPTVAVKSKVRRMTAKPTINTNPMLKTAGKANGMAAPSMELEQDEPEPLDPKPIVVDGRQQAQQLVIGSLRKKAPAVNQVMSFLEENKEAIAWLKEVGFGIAKAIEANSQRNAALRQKEIDAMTALAAKKSEPVAVELPPFASLTVNERMAWMSRGGMKAYMLQAGVPRPTGGSQTPASIIQAPLNTAPAPTYAPPAPGRPVEASGSGRAGLAELRAKMAAAGQIAMAPGAPAPQQEPIAQPPAAPVQIQPNHPAPTAQTPATTSTPSPDEASAMMKRYADDIAKTIGDIPQADFEKMRDDGKSILDKTVEEVKGFIPREHHLKLAFINKSTPLRKLVDTVSETALAPFRAFKAEELVAHIAAANPTRDWLNEDESLSFLARTITDAQNAMGGPLRGPA